MVKAYIFDSEIDLVGDIILNRNRKEAADYAKITILNERKKRYEPLTVIEIGETEDKEQYVIQADEPLLLKDGLYEHKINLIETIDVFETVFPVDRAFTAVETFKSIREILDIYIRELKFYQDFKFKYVDDDLFDTTIPNKEYSGASLAEIVYDLFRNINAIPRVAYDIDTDEWVLTHELYTQKRNAITLSTEGEQSTVNDIDYATEVLAKSRNAVDENNLIWYPSKTDYITPRTEGTMFQTSALRYEIGSPIMALDKVVTRLDISGDKQFIDVEYLKLPDDTYLEVDIKNNTLTEDEFNALQSVGKDFIADPDDDRQVKENCISYDLESKYINNLFSQISGFLGFTDNIYHLRNAINSNILTALSSVWDDLIDNYLYNQNTGLPASEERKTYYKSLSDEQIFNITNDLQIFYITTKIEDIEIKVRYRPKRDIDFVAEKYNIGTLNKASILNNQRDSFIDIGRYIENTNALANRIGNVIENVTESFDTWAERWKLGDYVDEWLIIDVRYQVDTNNIVCIADMAKGFSNTDREYSISRQPSAYTYTGEIVQSNFIYRQYIELHDTFDKQDNSLLTDLSKRIALNIFDYDSTYNKPLRHANVFGENQYLDASLVGVGRGNTMLWHFEFDDPRIAGNGMIKQTDAGQGTYAWYKKPLFYANINDFTLDRLRLTLSNEVNFKTDTTTKKYYPEVFVTLEDYWESKLYPIDKDTNASLAFTNQLIAYSNNDNIVIGNAFTKYNNLIQEFDTVPTLKVYRGLSAYTVFDKYVRDTDTLVNDAQINLTSSAPYTLTVLDDSFAIMDYWCLAYDDEIVIAGNNSISEIKFSFKMDRESELDKFNDVYLMYLDKTLEFNFQATVELMELLRLSLEETLTYEFNTDAEVIVPYKYNYNKTLEYDFQVVTNVKSPFKVYYDKTLSYEFSAGIDLIAPYKYNYEETLDYQFSAEITLIEPYKVSYENILQYKFNVNAEIVIPEKFNYNKILGFDFNVTAVVGDLRWNFISSQGTEPTNPTYIDGGTDTSVSETVSPSDSPSDYNLGDIVYYNDGDPQTPTYYIYKVI